jgi:hypothetical protein
MHQLIPEHPASYSAELLVIAMVALAVFLMVLAW